MVRGHNVVLGIDPGPHIGIALVEFDAKGEPVQLETRTIVADIRSAVSMRGVYMDLATFITETFPARCKGIGPGDVVCERFMTVSPAVAGSLDARCTLHLCGWIEGLCLTHFGYLAWQNPSERVPFVGKAGTFKTRTPHEKSALAHAFKYGWASHN